MSMTSSGPICDICGDYILLEPINFFSCKGIAKTLHAHDKCKLSVEAAAGDWKRLPDGPLRKAFEQAEEQGKVNA
jgi:hypothetical protein